MQRTLSAAASMFLLIAGALSLRAVEMTWEYSVQVSATVQTSPAQITLSWPQDQCMAPTSYTVYRKSLNGVCWGTGVSLPGTATSYTDTSVASGGTYEYQIVKVTSRYNGYGYIYSGINAPMIDDRGKLLLVVDDSCAASLADELDRLQRDIAGDGWTVIRLDVGRTDSVVSVKNQIKAQYDADPGHVKAVFLFGHVPVPYSGDIVPDGHVPHHQGAWPCDGYYGDMEGIWTDTSVTDTGAQYARNRNVPGDGKFDQSYFPAPLKLMVGRVDLANMPGAASTGGPATFPSELDLLRNYLNKDHKFRTGQFNLPRRAVVGDFFGVRSGEAFAASAWRNFASFIGASNVTSIPIDGAWAPMLRTNACLWAYGCGAGSFETISGLGNSDSYYDVNTREVYTNDIKAPFVLVFGSWLGDWDSQDNIMRCILALPTYGLASAWSGRPHWFLHHMALGEPIGYSALLTQNNGPNGLYRNQVNSAANQIHIALMGDPTLRMHPVAPPMNLTAAANGANIALNWIPSSDSVVGYHLYSASNPNGPFKRLTASPITQANCSVAKEPGVAAYMVRAVKLETSASGTYYNPSQGAFLSTDAIAADIAGSGGKGANPISASNATVVTNLIRASTTTSAGAVTNRTSSSATTPGSATTSFLRLHFSDMTAPFVTYSTHCRHQHFTLPFFRSPVCGIIFAPHYERDCSVSDAGQRRLEIRLRKGDDRGQDYYRRLGNSLDFQLDGNHYQGPAALSRPQGGQEVLCRLSCNPRPDGNRPPWRGI
jgi:hypothetical protein